MISAKLGINALVLDSFDSHKAQTYLADRVKDTLVVIPSRVDNLPFAVIEVSLISGLNIICSDAGGIPDIIGRETEQLFEPFVPPLTRKLEEWLARGPRSAAELGRYNVEQANELWLSFHEEVSQHAREIRTASIPSQSTGAVASAAQIDTHRPIDAPVDVCVPYYNLGPYLPDLLESLTEQTTSDFNLFVVNDGSTDPESTQVFEEMKVKYKRDGWHFISTVNRGVCAARNYAASLGNAEYICFVDADNVAAPDMVEQFVEAMRHSNDDCLTCYFYAFKGKTPYAWRRSKTSGSRILHPPLQVWVPLGNAPVGNVLSNTYGDGNCIIRRSVFEEIGGFTEDYPKYINHEDRELLTILSLSEYKLDVIPEFLFFYRVRPESRLRTTVEYQNDERVLRQYRDRLQKLGLGGMASMMLGMFYAMRDSHGSGPRQDGAGEYQQLVAAIQRTVDSAVPADSDIVVVSKGHDELLHQNGRRAWHFPSDENGSFTGHPASGSAAVATLKRLQSAGADHVVLPSTMYWYLGYYPEFFEHLSTRYNCILSNEICMIYKAV